MKQLTLRGFDEELERCLRGLAREGHLSLNQAALVLMRRGAGLADDRLPVRAAGPAIDSFVGVWSPEDEAELLAAIEPFERIDPELWQ